MSRVLEWKSGQLLVGDMGVRLGELEECSVDACITDPPYHLGFMSLGWDGGDVGFRTETWAAVYRVLKPGAYLLSVGGPRTYHRMASAVEGAGFEIRDCIGWCHSQGVPKSVDVAGEIERSTGAGPAEWAVWLQLRRKELGMSREDLAEAVACAPVLVRDWEEGREGRGVRPSTSCLRRCTGRDWRRFWATRSRAGARAPQRGAIRRGTGGGPD